MHNFIVNDFKTMIPPKVCDALMAKNLFDAVIHELSIHNTDQDKLVKRLKSLYSRKNLHAWISSAFTWNDSVQGLEFWRNIL